MGPLGPDEKDPLEPLVDEVAYWAWVQWWRMYDRKLDDEIEPYLTTDVSCEPWLRRIRKSLHISASEVARRLHMSQQNYAKLEQREETGQITVSNLKKAAEALDCEVVYAIRPKSRRNFSRVLFDELLPITKRDLKLKNLRSYYRANEMANIAGALMNDAWFRRRIRWSKRGAWPFQEWMRESHRNTAKRLAKPEDFNN